MPKFERDVEIDATVETVWQVMADPATWAQWFPGVDSVANPEPISQGKSFNWTSGDRTGQITIVDMEPLKRLKVLTSVGNDQDSHVFLLKPSGGFLGLKADECKVEYTLDTLMGGGLLADFVAGGNPKDAINVNKTLHRLRQLVESAKA